MVHYPLLIMNIEDIGSGMKSSGMVSKIQSKRILTWKYTIWKNEMITSFLEYLDKQKSYKIS